MVKVSLLERLQRFPRALLEHPVAVPRRLRIQIGHPFFEQFSDSLSADFLIVGRHLFASLELAFDAGAFVDEKHHDVDRRLAKMNAQGRMVEFPAQQLHAVDQQLKALDLHLGAGKPVQDGPVPVLFVE